MSEHRANEARLVATTTGSAFVPPATRSRSRSTTTIDRIHRRSRIGAAVPFLPLLAATLLTLPSPAGGYEGAARPFDDEEEVSAGPNSGGDSHPHSHSGSDDAPQPPPQPQLTRPPSIKTFVEAEYPPERLEAGEGAEVVFLITIDATGSVSDAEIIESGGEDFDAAATAALLRFEFEPAEIDHVPAAIRLEYRYVFEPRVVSSVEEEPEGAAPPVNLTGRVLQRGTRDPIPEATVFLPDHDLVAETDEEGRFEIRGVPAGETRIHISEVSHRNLSLVEEIREGEVTELTAYIWKRLDSGFEATVRAQRDKREVSRRTLVQEELTTVPGTFGDPLRVLQNMPGMARAPYGSGALLVRGAQPQDTSVLVDGVPIPLLYHFGGGPSVLNPALIGSIDFYPGAYSAKYGRAIAGVVDVSTKPATPTRLHGNVEIDLFDAGFYLETPLSRERNLGAIAVAGRRSYIDVLLPPLLDAVRPPGMSAIVAAPRYWDYQGRYDLELGRHRFELLAFGSNDLMTVAQAGTTETQGFTLNSVEGFHRFRGQWTTRTDSGWTIQLAPTFGLTTQVVDFSDQLALDVFSWDANVRGAVHREWSRTLRFETGIDLNLNRYQLRFDLPGTPQYRTFPGENPQLPNQLRELTATLATYAGYAEVAWSPLKGLRIIPGVRLELYDLPRGLTPSLEPRLTVRQDIVDGTTVKAAFGWFRQAAQPVDLEDDFGNPDLGLLASRQLVVGVEQRLLPRLTLDLQGFFNWRRQLVVGSDAVVERDGQMVSERLRNGGRGHAYGLELLLKQELTNRAFGWVAYTLSRSEQRNERTGEYLPMSYDQAHILTMVGSYKLDGGWELGARFRLTSGRPDTPVRGADFDADTNGYRYLSGIPGSIRGATFHQLDLRVEKEWTFNTWRMSTYLDIQNVYNAENPEMVLWDYRYRESAPLRGIPFLPTFGLTGAF